HARRVCRSRRRAGPLRRINHPTLVGRALPAARLSRTRAGGQCPPYRTAFVGAHPVRDALLHITQKLRAQGALLHAITGASDVPVQPRTHRRSRRPRRPAEREDPAAGRSEDRADRPALLHRSQDHRGHQLREPEVGTAARRRGGGMHWHSEGTGRELSRAGAEPAGLRTGTRSGRHGDRGVHRGQRGVQPQEHQRQHRRIHSPLHARAGARQGRRRGGARLRLHRARLPLPGRGAGVRCGARGQTPARTWLPRDLAGRHHRRGHAGEGARDAARGGAGSADGRAGRALPRHLRPGAGEHPRLPGGRRARGGQRRLRHRRLPVCQGRHRQRGQRGCGLHAARLRAADRHRPRPAGRHRCLAGGAAAQGHRQPRHQGAHGGRLTPSPLLSLSSVPRSARGRTVRTSPMLRWTATLLLLLLCPLATAATTQKGDWLLLPDRVWTADGDAAHAGWAVLVHDGAIAAVGPAASVQAPAGAQRVELPGATLTPGLVDLHSHLFLHPYNETLWNDQVLTEPQDYRTLEAAKHARDTLLAGFTALRDLGTEGAGFADVSIKRAIEEGLIPGPRLFVATRAIVATASYGPGPRGFRPDLDLPQGAQPVTGTDAAMAAVREQAARGADWIKLYADYRVGDHGKTMPTLTPAEIKAIVD